MAEPELEKIAGSSNVLTEARVIEEYSKDASFVPQIMPRCVVKPGNAQDVQGIVKWANATQTPLVPVSSGSPHFRGDTVPGTEGAVIVDLSRMKRIIRVDARNKVAMVEPGVTFSELQTELEKAGLCAYMPLVPRSSKSVVGSILEREPITMPSHHWDITDPLLCVEVVFGTGDTFRTGEASGPDTVEEQWEIDRVQMNPFGHSHVDFQRLLAGAEGTMGIVTWATVKCCYLSKLSRALLVPSAQLEPLLELAYKVLRFRLGGKLFILNGLNLACLLGSGLGEMQERKSRLPAWVMVASFEGYGVLPEKKVEYEEADFRAMAESCGVNPASEIDGASAEGVLAVVSQPSDEPYWKKRLKGGCHDIFFLTTLDKTPEFVAAMHETAQRSGYPLENAGVYIQPTVQGTSCHCDFNLYYNPNDPAEAAATERMVSEGTEKIAGMGGFFSRPYGAWKDIAYRCAGGTLSMQRKLKEIFDPKAILNPGKLCF